MQPVAGKSLLIAGGLFLKQKQIREKISQFEIKIRSNPEKHFKNRRKKRS